MRLTTLRQLSGFSTQRRSPVELRLQRCECTDCGAQCNAIAVRAVHASCPNCGASSLVAVSGATAIGAPRR
ncbi:MAG TPA: hypothetical protein VHX62_05805 [Solirubrobacteraceae bacterium]|nr:hypothetical protein [Solirubrobacteraceae bacterium]